jgi:hypothetical protein
MGYAILNKQLTIADLQTIKNQTSCLSSEQIDFLEMRNIVCGDDITKAALALVSLVCS